MSSLRMSVPRAGSGAAYVEWSWYTGPARSSSQDGEDEELSPGVFRDENGELHDEMMKINHC
jgi:hypothetical protein